MKTTLTMQPVSYIGRRLEEAGEVVVRAFYPLLRDFRINSLMRYDGPFLHESRPLKDNLRKLIADDRRLRFAADGISMLDWFAGIQAGTCLFVTAIPVLDEKQKRLSGLAYEETGPAFVSTSGMRFLGSDDGDEHFHGIVSTFMHEIGHIFGLEHHKKSYKRESFGMLCPMTTAHIRRLKLGLITPREYLLMRSKTMFCDDCYNRMHIENPVCPG